MVPSDFEKQVSGYGLTTAQILYRRPDHRWLLQSYLWQDYDVFPNFPELRNRRAAGAPPDQQFGTASGSASFTPPAPLGVIRPSSIVHSGCCF